MIIYKIVNKINGKIYIGQTKDGLSKRIARHIRTNKYYVQKALNKYGLESFIISVIDEADTKQILDEKEKYWITLCDCRAPGGYNCTEGGEGTHGYVYTEEVRQKNRVAHTGKHPSAETKAKMSRAAKGKTRSPESIAKWRVSHAGYKVSEETRKKMSELKKGKQPRLGSHASEETLVKLRAKRLTEAQKQRLREVNLGKHPSEEARKKMRDNSKARGKHSWNYGLTKETDERVANNYKRAVNQ